MLVHSVNQGHIAAAAVVVNYNAEIRNKVVEEILRAGKGNLIRFAVAVGILRLERFQNLIEFIQGGGHFQAQLIQPRLVDEGIDPAVAGTAEEGQRVDVAVGCGNPLQGAGALFQLSLQIGAIGLNQIVEGDEGAFRAIFVHLIGRQVGFVEHIRIVSAVEHQAFLFFNFHRQGRLDIPADIGLGFQFLECCDIRKLNIAIYNGKHAERFLLLQRE